jgi:alpha-galactosidase
MSRIVFIGAGSIVFTRNLVRDILTFPILQDSTIVLMDIDRKKLDFAKKAVQTLVDRSKCSANIEATLDRKKALKNADAVLITVLAGSVQVWRHDIEIPKKFGVDFNIGDTRGVAGIFRALRTIPLMLDICKDIEHLCPDAIVLNYTNPMAMLCRAMQRKNKDLKITGLCHSVQGTAEMIAGWINAPMNEIEFVCAGINHQAWYLKYEWNGKDAYPLISKAVKRKKVYNEEIVRNELFLHQGYYITESSGHNSEYNWWFRKRPDLIEKYCAHGTGWNPGKHAYILKDYLKRERTWKSELKNLLTETDEMSLERGHEYAAYIINASISGEAFEFNGNVPNTGLITNLPDGACVEVPVLANKRGFNPMFVGSLPPQLAALNNLSIATEEMTVEATMSGDPELVFHAVSYDPLSACALSLAEIKKMVKRMLKANQPYLPQFKNIEI